MRKAISPELAFLMRAAHGWNWRKARLPGSPVRRYQLQLDEFDGDQLAIGTYVETEHTSSPAIALEIAMAHLLEDEEYYEKLAHMERKK